MNDEAADQGSHNGEFSEHNDDVHSPELTVNNTQGREVDHTYCQWQDSIVDSIKSTLGLTEDDGPQVDTEDCDNHWEAVASSFPDIECIENTEAKDLSFEIVSSSFIEYTSDVCDDCASNQLKTNEVNGCREGDLLCKDGEEQNSRKDDQLNVSNNSFNISELETMMRSESKDADVTTVHAKTSDIACSPVKLATSEHLDANTNMAHVNFSDIACSPMKLATSEQGTMVLSEVVDANTSMAQEDFSDIACSPVKPATSEQGTMAGSECRDADTSMAKVDFSDIACSPMKLPTSEQGTMAGSECRDVDTSMAHVDFTDIACSPLKLVTLEQGTMAGIECKDADTSMLQVDFSDIACSPLKIATTEQGTMVMSDVVDADTSMIQIGLADVAVMAIPSLEERCTMTDLNGTVNRETAMTPIKRSPKSGQR